MTPPRVSRVEEGRRVDGRQAFTAHIEFGPSNVDELQDVIALAVKNSFGLLDPAGKVRSAIDWDIARFLATRDPKTDRIVRVMTKFDTSTLFPHGGSGGFRNTTNGPGSFVARNVGSHAAVGHGAQSSYSVSGSGNISIGRAGDISGHVGHVNGSRAPCPSAPEGPSTTCSSDRHVTSEAEGEKKVILFTALDRERDVVLDVLEEICGDGAYDRLEVGGLYSTLVFHPTEEGMVFVLITMDDMGAQKMGICVQTCLSQLGTPLLAVLIGCAGGTGDLKVGSIVFPSHVAYVHNKGALLDMQRKEGALMLKAQLDQESLPMVDASHGKEGSKFGFRRHPFFESLRELEKELPGDHDPRIDFSFSPILERCLTSDFVLKSDYEELWSEEHMRKGWPVADMESFGFLHGIRSMGSEQRPGRFFIVRGISDDGANKKELEAEYGLDLQRMVTEKAIYAVLAYLLDGKHLTVAEEKKCRARWIRKVARL